MLQLPVAKEGILVEFGFVPGSENESVSPRELPLEPPAESQVLANVAYTNYQVEDRLFETDQVRRFIAGQTVRERTAQALPS